MTTRYPDASSVPLLTRVDHFEHTRDAATPAARLETVRAAAREFRNEMLQGPVLDYYQSFDLIRVPYPLKYALRDACPINIPFIHILNRLFVMQWKAGGKTITVLGSPSDVYGGRETPFFKRVEKKFEWLPAWTKDVFAPVYSTVDQAVEKIGLQPEQVDYITYDHLHTQDIRKWFGSDGRPGHFPNAKLLVMRQEWQSAQALTAPQQAWYCPGGVAGIDPAKIVLLDGDYLLGDSIALVRTPGHTEGNHSIVAHTPEGLMVTSENGVSADSYAPQNSEIPGLRSYHRHTGMEVVLNGNTLERGLDQYISMVQEKEIAGPSPRNDKFSNFVPSSELAGYWLFRTGWFGGPLKPTFSFGPLKFGDPITA